MHKLDPFSQNQLQDESINGDWVFDISFTKNDMKN